MQNAAPPAPLQAPDTDQAAPNTLATANLAESFISRQQLGINNTPDAGTMDATNMPEEAVDATEGGRDTADTQAVTPDLLRASAPRVEGFRIELDVVQPRPLCSQEWKIQHVSSPCITTPMTRVLCTPPPQL